MSVQGATRIALGGSIGERYRSPRLLVGLAVFGGVLIWVLMRGRPNGSTFLDVALIWLMSMACIVVAAAPSPWLPLRAWPAHLVHAMSDVRTDVLVAGSIGIVALLLRSVALDAHPFLFGGDEGEMAVAALDVLGGKLTNPFGTGWFAIPTLFMFMQAASIRLFGDSVVGIRMVSAIIGALTIVGTYVLIRHWFGTTTAAVATTLLAVFHYHIHFSRIAVLHLMDPFFLVLTLYFLDRGLLERRRLHCALAGLAIGFAQYFYYGARLLLVVAAAYVLFATWRSEGGPATALRSPEFRGRLARCIGWILLGAVLVYLPMLAHYADYPTEFLSRFNQVSIFSSGWLEKEQAATGKSALLLIVELLQKSALLPFKTIVSPIFYEPGVPLVGPPMAALTALGLVLATLRAGRREYFGLVVAYWTSILGLTLTDDPTQSQRFLIATPLLAAFAAIGLMALLRVLRIVVGVPRSVAVAAGAGAVMLIGIWNYQHYFFREEPSAHTGGENTIVATELAYYLRDMGPTTVYFGGGPRMWYGGFRTLPFIARQAIGKDIDEPLKDDSPALSQPGRLVFVFLPERASELDIVRRWYPNGVRREHRPSQAGERSRLLFVSYEVNYS